MKKDLETNWFSAKITTPVLFVLAAITVLNNSCTKSSIEPLHDYDKNYFFTVNINDKTYTTYAWVDRSYSYITDTPYIMGVYAVHQDSTGVLPWVLFIGANAERTRTLYVPAPGTCTAQITLKKTGDFLGQYQVIPPSENFFDNIEGKTYLILAGTAVFTINSLSPPGTAIPVVEGTFRCTCYERNTNNAFPATGSFRLKAH